MTKLFESMEHANLRLMLEHGEGKSTSTSFDPKNEHTLRVMLRMLEGQRQHVVEWNRDPNVDEEIIRQDCT